MFRLLLFTCSDDQKWKSLYLDQGQGAVCVGVRQGEVQQRRPVPGGEVGVGALAQQLHAPLDVALGHGQDHASVHSPPVCPESLATLKIRRFLIIFAVELSI